MVKKAKHISLLRTVLLLAMSLIVVLTCPVMSFAENGYTSTSTKAGKMMTDNSRNIVASMAVNDSVNLRSGPGTEFTVIDTISIPNYILSISDMVYNENDGLYFGSTIWSGREGWVSLRQLHVVRFPSEGISAPDFYITTSGSSGSVFVRSGAGMTYPAVAEVPNGVRMHVTDMSYSDADGQYYLYVTKEGIYGWLSMNNSKFVKQDGDSKSDSGSPAAPKKILYKAKVCNTGTIGLELTPDQGSESPGSIWIPEGTEIGIEEIGADNRGTVTYNGITGKVNLRYTVVTSSYPPVQPTYGFISEATYFVQDTGGVGLNIRTAPSPNVSTYGQMPEGTPVRVQAIQSGWAFVNYNGTYGWAGLDYLGAPQNPFPVAVFDTDNGSSCSLKASPAWESATYAWIPEGAELTIIHTISDYWGYTSYNGVYGWIYLRNTKVSSSYAAAAPGYGFIDQTQYIVSGTTGEGLQLRVKPSPHVSTYGMMPEGTKVQATAIIGEWAYVNYNGIYGWAHLYYLEEYPRKLRLSRDLEEGMQGDDVMILQERLHELGYLAADPDGIFGWRTTEAVKSFQIVNGLGYSDGLVSNWTASKLNDNPIPYADRKTDQEYAACYSAYRDILAREKNSITGYDGVTDGYEPRNIFIGNIYGDELPELVYVKTEYINGPDANAAFIHGPYVAPNPAYIHILTYKNGGAVELYNEIVDKSSTDSGFRYFYIYQFRNDNALYGYQYYGDGDGVEEFYKYAQTSDGRIEKQDLCWSEWDSYGIFLGCTAFGEVRNTPGYYDAVAEIQGKIRCILQYNDGCGKFVDDFIHTYGCSALTYNEAVAKLAY